MIVRPTDFTPTMKPPIRKASTMTATLKAICPPESVICDGSTLRNCGARINARVKLATRFSAIMIRTPIPIHFQSSLPAICAPLERS